MGNYFSFFCVMEALIIDILRKLVKNYNKKLFVIFKFPLIFLNTILIWLSTVFSETLSFKAISLYFYPSLLLSNNISLHLGGNLATTNFNFWILGSTWFTSSIKLPLAILYSSSSKILFFSWSFLYYRRPK